MAAKKKKVLAHLHLIAFLLTLSVPAHSQTCRVTRIERNTVQCGAHRFPRSKFCKVRVGQRVRLKDGKLQSCKSQKGVK